MPTEDKGRLNHQSHADTARQTPAHDHASHTHSHQHGQGGHRHGPASYDRAFAIGIPLNIVFIVAEVIYGFAANSLALLADAAHNVSDVLGLALAWGAVWLSRKAPTPKRTYGFGQSSILASLINSVVLLVSVGAIALESVQRFSNPEPVVSGMVMWVAGLGILINGATALLFISGRKNDLNIKGAFLHMASDAGVSLGVVVAAFVISLTGWLWLDPVISLAIGAVIAAGTWSLLRDSINMALHAVPAGIDHDAVQKYLRGLPAVVDLHDLHIWGLSTTETALTVHLVVPASVVMANKLPAEVAAGLKKLFGIGHATIQTETDENAEVCVLAPDHVI